MHLRRPGVFKARRAQQGAERSKVVELRTLSDPMMTMETALQWRQDYYETYQQTLAEQQKWLADLPSYLLILGDLHQVPAAIHRVLFADLCVGRLAFTKDDDSPNDENYESYVHKVLHWERSPASTTQGTARFFVAEDGTAATQAGLNELILPSLDHSARDGGFHHLMQDSQGPEEMSISSPGQLLEAVERLDPAVLLTVSHGVGAPAAGWPSGDRQRQQQGALSFGTHGQLAASELGDRPFLPGGIWYMLASYGAVASTPSHFRPWLQCLRSSGQSDARLEALVAGLPKPTDRPFIASLPQALLARQDGPLAFIGQLDLAWVYGFPGLSASRARLQSRRLQYLVKRLLERHRVGGVFGAEMAATFASYIEVAISHDPESSKFRRGDAAHFAHQWMIHQDLMGHLLLGDPAVRLPISQIVQPEQKPVDLDLGLSRRLFVFPKSFQPQSSSNISRRWHYFEQNIGILNPTTS